MRDLASSSDKPKMFFSWLVLRVYLRLLWIDALLARRGFPAVHRKLSRTPLQRNGSGNWTEAELCHAINLACIFYFKPVLCLARSAVTTIVLRESGFAAELVIGAQSCPFRAHAWVEIAGRVANDKPYIPELYAVLDRC